MSPKRARTLVAVLLLSACLALAGCGSKSGTTTGGSTSSAKTGGATGADFWASFDAAQAAVEAKAPDAVLVTTESQVATLPALPSIWAFTYMSPSTKHAWRVITEVGKPKPSEDMGTSSAKVDFKGVMSKADIKISADEAIELARSAAKAEGMTPKNLAARGMFISVEGGDAMGMKQGLWTVTLAESITGEGLKQYTVNMSSGSVAPVKQ